MLCAHLHLPGGKGGCRKSPGQQLLPLPLQELQGGKHHLKPSSLLEGDEGCFWLLQLLFPNADGNLSFIPSQHPQIDPSGGTRNPNPVERPHLTRKDPFTYASPPQKRESPPGSSHHDPEAAEMILLPPLQAPAEQLPPVVLGCHGEPPPLLGRAGSGLPPAEKQPPQPPCREEGGLSCCDSPRPLTTPWLGRLPVSNLGYFKACGFQLQGFSSQLWGDSGS